MSRSIAELPAGSRITDYISLGVVAKTFPLDKIRAVAGGDGERAACASGTCRRMWSSIYVIALALYMQSSYREVLRCLLEGIQWLVEPSAGINVAGNSGISQARTRLGWEPLRQLHDEVVKPIAVAATKGAWYRAWRLVSLDGSTLDVADEKGNDEAFGRPGASRGAERVSTDPLRIAGGERHPCPVRQPDGGLRHQRNRPGKDRIAQSRQGHVVPGGPRLFRVRDVEAGGGYGSGSAVAGQKEHPPALRKTPAGRILSEPHLSRRSRTSGAGAMESWCV